MINVKYWWTEDGSAEVRERTESIIKDATECYHCVSRLQRGARVSLLTSLYDNEKYILCTTCADRSTERIV